MRPLNAPRVMPNLQIQHIPLHELKHQQLVYIIRYGCAAITDMSGVYAFFDLGKRPHNVIPQYLSSVYEVTDIKTALKRFPYHLIQAQWRIYVHGARRSGRVN